VVDRDWFEGRLARISPLRLLLPQAVPIAGVTVFLVGNLRVGQIGWAVVFASILALDAIVIAWWGWVRLARRRDAATFRGISRRASLR
jgi:hypothetical protein